VHINLLYTVFGLTKLDDGPREMPEWVALLREVIRNRINLSISESDYHFTHPVYVPSPLDIHPCVGGSSLPGIPRAENHAAKD
jgi:hypothetical protein